MFQEYGSESDFAIYAYSKVIMQGKLFQRCTHLLCCSVLSLGGNVNTRRMSKPEMGSIYIYRILNKHWYTFFCLQLPPRENWVQYVRRVYAIAINFPCIIILCANRVLCNYAYSQFKSNSSHPFLQFYVN